MKSKVTASLFQGILNRAAEFLNSRPPRERNMMVVLSVLFILAADYLIILSPVLVFFQETAPKLSSLQVEQNDLKEDHEQSAKLKEKWEHFKALAAESEKMTIAPAATAMLLENLSKEAGQTGVKITSVRPGEVIRNRKSNLFSVLPIHLSGIAGAHELGRFLLRLESGTTFFRVANLSIHTNPVNERRHQIELTLEACQLDAEKKSAQGGPHEKNA